MSSLAQSTQALVFRVSAAYTLRALARELQLRSSVWDEGAHCLAWHANWYADHDPDCREADEVQIELMERLGHD